MRIIDRYIITELIKPFIMVIMAFIVVMISIRLGEDVDRIIRDKIPIMVVIKTIVYRIPDFIVQALPIACLMSTLLTTSRFSRDHETTALRAAGVKFKRLMLPIIFLSIIISYISFIFSEKIVPLSNKLSQETIDNFSRKSKKGGLEKNNLHFRGPDNSFFNIQRVNVDNKQMFEIAIVDLDIDKNRRSIIAHYGTWNGTNWVLEEGVIKNYLKGQKFVSSEEQFTKVTINSKVDLIDVVNEQRDPKEMSSEKLSELIRIRKTSGFQDIDLEVELNLKYAKSFATFFSAMIAAPLGFIFARLGNYIGVALSIILIFVYYTTESIGRALGLNELVSPFVAGWCSNIVFAFIGLLLLWQVDRR